MVLLDQSMFKKIAITHSTASKPKPKLQIPHVKINNAFELSLGHTREDLLLSKVKTPYSPNVAFATKNKHKHIDPAWKRVRGGASTIDQPFFATFITQTCRSAGKFG